MIKRNKLTEIMLDTKTFFLRIIDDLHQVSMDVFLGAHDSANKDRLAHSAAVAGQMQTTDLAKTPFVPIGHLIR